MYLGPLGSLVKVNKGTFLISYRCGDNACEQIICNDVLSTPASPIHLEESVIRRRVDDQDCPNYRTRRLLAIT